MSFSYFPAEVLVQVFSKLRNTIDIFHLGLTCKTCYIHFKFEISRRIQRAKKDNLYLESLSYRCDPLLFLCDLSQPIHLQLSSPPSTFTIAKTFNVLKILFQSASPRYLKRFLTYHPININQVSSMIWFGRHLKLTMYREDEDPTVIDFMLSYIVEKFKPFRDYFPCKSSPLSYSDLTTGESTTVPPTNSKTVKIYKPVNTLQDYLVEILNTLALELSHHPRPYIYTPIFQKYIHLCETITPFFKAVEESEEPEKELRYQMRKLLESFFGRSLKPEELNESLQELYRKTFGNNIPKVFTDVFQY